MIKIIKGVYTTEAPNEAGIYESKTPASDPFEQSPAKEAELVELGAAEYVEKPEEKSEKPAAGATAAKRKKDKETACEP
jgi:hypothetical protein